jgi:hypothetical protein
MLAKRFSITDSQRNVILANGHPAWRNHVAWALASLVVSGEIERSGQQRASDGGTTGIYRIGPASEPRTPMSLGMTTVPRRPGEETDSQVLTFDRPHAPFEPVHIIQRSSWKVCAQCVHLSATFLREKFRPVSALTISGFMHLDLTEEQTEALIRELSAVIDRDKFPLSPHVQVLRSILHQLRPEPVREQLPPRKSYELPSRGRYERRR